MHSFKKKSATFIYHGDFGGEVYIVGNTEEGIETKIKVDSEDIIDFVAEYVRKEMIDCIESMDSRELLRTHMQFNKRKIEIKE
ncbi:hypothetical protein [Paenibacillus agilis]|uniref:Uncharacterized protein n=1 Tax=Paenibacillus agilis TaxID=3020863 RepID=A0A559ID58_9BACL|nr:hypothetical protein [Paenibacillus agilis]TVX85599.1 hypothetical protein FPZ44_24910 [Paenibacillus agilis]